MKKLSLLLGLCIASLTLFGQSKKIREIKAKFWNEQAPYRDVVEVPEKWKNESAVVIYQEYNYSYKGMAKSVNYVESTRRRVKLQDKAAVEEYSEFSFADKFKVTKGFSKKGGRIFAGFKVIKSDGTETEIDLDDAVEIKSDSEENIKKIAIPGLQAGDVLDYYYHIYEPFYATGAYVFEPIVTDLSGRYPIMEQRLGFSVGKNFFINFKSLHGAPELKVTDDSKRKVTVYSLVNKDCEKSKDIRWYYANREEPTVKFQVVYARKNRLEKQADAFLGKKSTVKKGVNKSEVMKYLKDRVDFSYSRSQHKTLISFLKDKKLTGKDKLREMVIEAYYYKRYQLITKKLEPILFYQEQYTTYIDPYLGYFPTEMSFLNNLGSFFNKMDVSFDLVVTIPRSLSLIDDLLLADEMTPMLRINLPEPIFISLCYLHTDYDYIPYTLEGTEGYVMKLDEDAEVVSIKKGEIPSSKHEDNITKIVSRLTFDTDNIKTLKVDRTVKHNGHNKLNYISDLLYLYDYIPEANSYYDKEDYIDRIPIKRKVIDKIRPKLDKKIKEDKESQKKVFENVLRNDLDIDIEDYISYAIIKTGRYKKEPLMYKESFELEGQVKKAGPNYIVEIGKLIGGQVALKEDEMERSQDVYMSYPRSYDYTVKIEIPEGYTVQGLDKLNVKVENETGGFVSTAVVTGDLLEISTYKYYRHNFEKAADWPKLVAFLEAAFEFTQQKVLLKKS